MFLKPDEHLIVQQSNQDVNPTPWLPCIDLSTDDLKRLKNECGINVVFEWAYWSLVEKNGKYGWSNVDKRVKRVRDAGMRLIMCSPISVPQDLADVDMYGMGRDGNPYRGILSFWNPKSREYQRKFLQAVVDRYSGTDVTIIYTGLACEYLLWNDPVYLDKAAVADFKERYGEDIKKHAEKPITITPELEQWMVDGVTDHLLSMQEILVGQHNEVWDLTQWKIGKQSMHNGVFGRPLYFAAYKKRWPDATRWLLQFTYMRHGLENAKVVHELLEECDCKTIVEANYCEGLRDENTAERAIAGGDHTEKSPLRWHGQIVSPLHAFRGHKTLEPWMMGVMKATADKWRAARDVPKAQ